MKERKRSEYRARLPGVLRTPAGNIEVRDQRIPHTEILRAIEKCADLHGNLAAIYRDRILPQQTRTIRLLGKKSPATIINTLLGYEVQAGYKRIQCPDMVTARYIRLFSELGCHSIQLPYDPTVTADLIPELEAAVENIKKGVSGIFPGDPQVQRYVVRKIYGIVRRQLRFL
jgi:hypothetical protein